MILTISAARDVTAYAQRAESVPRAAPTPIPIGTGGKENDANRLQAGRQRSSRPPRANSYALVVSTVDVRKNHLLLFRIWRRLLDDMPAELVATLVVAGQVGWLVTDLMEHLQPSRLLDGKIIRIDSPTAQELEALYEACLFTLFRSPHEGWGLLATQSGAFGRPGVIFNARCLSETGGSLARFVTSQSILYVDRARRKPIEDWAGLRAWRDRARCEFKPVEWTQSARAALKGFGPTEDTSHAAQPEMRRCA